MSEKKSKKVTVSDEIPVRPPPPPRPTARVEATNHYASAGTASDPDLAGPGVQQQWQNSQDYERAAASVVNGHNPALGQQANVHMTNSFNPQVQQQAPFLPASGCYYQNIGPIPHQPGVFHQPVYHNPSYLINHNNQPNLVSHTYAYQPYFDHIMAGYSNGEMPNTGQHFQPPVPDTTYGPIEHVFRPRSDHQGVPIAMPGGQMYSPASYQSAPCSCPFPNASGPMPGIYSQVQNGIMATAPMPMPMMSNQPQPFIVQGGQPMQSMPTMMPAQGIPAVLAAPGMPQPMGGCQPQIFAGNCAPNTLPPGMLPPDIMGMGRTQGEHQAELLQSAQFDNSLEPQDIKPADDDPGRMYLLRELDGNWTKRSRFTIDRLAARWYITPWGAFYAVRLED